MHIPQVSSTISVIDHIHTAYAQLQDRDKIENGDKRAPSLYTPYQFMLPLLQELYRELCGCPGEVDEVKIDENKALTAINPTSMIKCEAYDVAAIAYLSWDNDDKAFLIRRVYPTFQDLLSVSHVPLGWGATTIMLREMAMMAKDKCIESIECGFYSTVDPKDITTYPYTLPYLEENAKLKCKRIVCIPVFQHGHTDVPDDPSILASRLHGAFLVFGRWNEECAKSKGEFTAWVKRDGGTRQQSQFWKDVTSGVARIITIHNKKLGFGQSLSGLWANMCIKMTGQAEWIYEVELESDCKFDLKSVVERLGAAFRAPDYHSVQLPGVETGHNDIARKSMRLFVVPQGGMDGSIDRLKVVAGIQSRIAKVIRGEAVHWRMLSHTGESHRDRMWSHALVDRAHEMEKRERLHRLTRQNYRKRAKGDIVFCDVSLRIDMDVFDPSEGEGSQLLAECIRESQRDMISGTRILDVGTGSGILAILAAQKWPNARVMAIDYAEEAAKCAQKNVASMGLTERVQVLMSDAYDSIPIEHTYDVIICNPPFMDGLAADVKNHDWKGRAYDRTICDPEYKSLTKIIGGLKSRLNPDGVAWIAFSSVGDTQKIEELFESHGLLYSISRCIGSPLRFYVYVVRQ